MAQVSIFVFGLQGVGKSSCGRAFLQKNDVFEVSSSPKPCTSELKIGQNMVNGVMRRFVDIPGLDSTEEDNSPIMIDMVRSLNSKNIGINAFFLVISIQEPRLTSTIKNMIILLNNFFNDIECWKQAGIIFTKCNHDDSEEMEEKINSSKEYRIEVINFLRTLPNCQNINIELPCFFVNSKKWSSDIKTQNEFERICQFAKQFVPNVHNFQIAALNISESRDSRKVQNIIHKIRKPGQTSITTFAYDRYRDFMLDQNGKVIIPIRITLTQLYEYRLNWNPVEIVENIYIPVRAEYDFERMLVFPIVPDQVLETYIDHRKRSYWYKFGAVDRKTSRFTKELIIELDGGFVFKESNSPRYVLTSPKVNFIPSISPKCPAQERRDRTEVPSFLEITMI